MGVSTMRCARSTLCQVTGFSAQTIIRALKNGPSGRHLPPPRWTGPSPRRSTAGTTRRSYFMTRRFERDAKLGMNVCGLTVDVLCSLMEAERSRSSSLKQYQETQRGLRCAWSEFGSVRYVLLSPLTLMKRNTWAYRREGLPQGPGKISSLQRTHD